MSEDRLMGACEHRFGADLDDALHAARDAFWSVIAAKYPEVPHGDYGPEETLKWEHASRAAVEIWLKNNHPQHDARYACEGR